MRRTSFPFGPVFLLLFAACNRTPETGRFGEDKVELSFTDGRSLALPRVPSGSGARYADDQGNQFFGKGPEAILTRPGEADQICSTAEIGTPPADG